MPRNRQTGPGRLLLEMCCGPERGRLDRLHSKVRKKKRMSRNDRKRAQNLKRKVVPVFDQRPVEFAVGCGSLVLVLPLLHQDSLPMRTAVPPSSG